MKEKIKQGILIPKAQRKSEKMIVDLSKNLGVEDDEEPSNKRTINHK